MATALTAHPARTIVASILDLKGAPAFAEEPMLSNAPYAAMRDKVFLVAETVAALFDQSPAELTSAPGLSQLQTGFQQILAELNAFISNKNAGHIANASNYVEQQILSLLWAFGPKIDTLSPETVVRLFQQQAEFSRQTIAEVSAQRDALGITLTDLKIAAEAQQSKFDALSERVAQERAEAAAAVAKLDQQFAQNESARLTV
ncbi:hypothetical protein [Variovorax sp. N23]|uniref:hypothetical protein n=1 Tax=Variovorax sp. N23 TaxID=2980555 RepID=UPI0021CAC70B|nr:hypothetical protein [Variovorax sp. N23]MCU4119877.1 hypothetical protein [Variovorax sp. N23]